MRQAAPRPDLPREGGDGAPGHPADGQTCGGGGTNAPSSNIFIPIFFFAAGLKGEK
jgi:hypothetical protein